MTLFIVGLASGAASATLSLSLLSGSMLAVLLFLFAPLPILLASIGWNHRAGLVGALGASAFLLGLTGFETARGYAVSIGLPAWWLGYLALLARPRGEQPEDGVDWYPIGRLLVWIAVLGSSLILLSILMTGSISDYRDMLRTTFENFLRHETGAAPGAPIVLPGGGDAARVTELAVSALPPVGAAIWTANMVFNLWVAGRIAQASQRLTRPWPDLSAISLPRFVLAAFGVALFGSFIGGPDIGFPFSIVAAALAIVFSLLGLAFLHSATRGVGGRTMILTATYLLLAVQTWTLIFLAALGIAEHVFQLRARLAARGRPPANTKH
ncbi:DUF2232 domain-containing protein [Terrihabitans sp. B22-R8]|uniref:DUF2232 domain-containing protein n=1 Tax=Terrihabitans sp. B22-R8 TaxID=3425128 RepID=UPI00403C5696